MTPRRSGAADTARVASAPNKTQPTRDDAAAFLAAVPDERRRADAIAVNELMSEVTGASPVLWGSSIVGFGRQHYRYESGRSGEMLAVGFSPRKAALVLYGLTYDGSNADLLARLGPHTTGKGPSAVVDGWPISTGTFSSS